MEKGEEEKKKEKTKKEILSILDLFIIVVYGIFIGILIEQGVYVLTSNQYAAMLFGTAAFFCCIVIVPLLKAIMSALMIILELKNISL